MNYKKIKLVILSISLIGLTGCGMTAYVDYGSTGKILTHKEVLRDDDIKKDIKDGWVKYKEGDLVRLYSKSNHGTDYVIFKNYDIDYLNNVKNSFDSKFEKYLSKINFPYERRESDSYEELEGFVNKNAYYVDMSDGALLDKMESVSQEQYYSFANTDSSLTSLIGEPTMVHYIEGRVFLKLNDLNSFDLNEYSDFKELLEDLRGAKYTEKEIDYINSELTRELSMDSNMLGFDLNSSQDVLYHESFGIDKNIREDCIYYNIKLYNLYT